MLRAAVVGLGLVAERIHLPAMREVPELQIAGACDVDAARRDRIGRSFGIPSLYPDAESLIAAARPDLVVVGTPPPLHHRHTLLALRAGAHVFCEKPFVETVAQADEIVREATHAGRLVAVNNQYRHMAMYRETRALIDRRELGRPFLIQAWEQMHHPPSQETNWRAHLVRSTFFEFGTHVLDLICFLFDDLPIAIHAEMPHPRRDIAADVVVVVMLRFPGERVASIVLNRISHAPERYLEMRVDCEKASVRLSLGGVARATLDWSKALGRPTARVSFVKGGEARVEAGGRSRVIAREPQWAFATATRDNLRQFVARIQRRDGDQAPLHHARALIRIVNAAYESAEAGRLVALDWTAGQPS
jgi:predicted dehydrogenase